MGRILEQPAPQAVTGIIFRHASAAQAAFEPKTSAQIIHYYPSHTAQKV